MAEPFAPASFLSASSGPVSWNADSFNVARACAMAAPSAPVGLTPSSMPASWNADSNNGAARCAGAGAMPPHPHGDFGEGVEPSSAIKENELHQGQAGGRMAHGVFVTDPVIEKAWKAEAERGEIRAGCHTLLFFSIANLFKILWNIHYRIALYGCVKEDRSRIPMHHARIAIGFNILVAPFLVNAYRQLTMRAYRPVVVLWYLYVVMSSLPPMQLSCEELGSIVYDDVLRVKTGRCMHMGPNLTIAVRNVSCTMNSSTQMHMLMAWILISPRLWPWLWMMRWNWIFIFCLWLPLNLIDHMFQPYDANSDIFNSAVALSVCQYIATTRKYYLEKSTRNRIISAIKEKKATKKIFSILQFMVPPHVIKRMLLRPDTSIADPIVKVSILFIIISDFEHRAKTLRPADLLKFLNTNFEAWDRICSFHKVSKIETVAEEFVAAVGVMPEDIEEGRVAGHCVLLRRLVTVSAEILDHCAQSTVSVKMGMHTGPIVAGVIGKKLPRFRLFGDTINVAARMMQKGIDGKLQFGRETLAEMPKDFQVSVRGEIEMKGKGKVTAYVLKTEDRNGHQILVKSGDTRGTASDEQRKVLLRQKSVVDHLLASRRSPIRRKQQLNLLCHSSSELTFGASAGSVRSGPSSGLVGRRRKVSSTLCFDGDAGAKESLLDKDEEEASDESSSDDYDSGADDRPLRSELKPQPGELDEEDGEDQYKDFDEVLRSLAKSHDSQRDLRKKIMSCGLRTNFFTNELNEEWVHWHHITRICHKLEERFDRHRVALAALTAFDTYVFVMRAHCWQTQLYPHILYGLRQGRGQMGTDGLMRLPVFLICRFLSYLLLSWWCMQAKQCGRFAPADVRPHHASNLVRDNWISKNPKSTWLILATYCLIGVLTFVSYDAVSNVKPDWIGEWATSDKSFMDRSDFLDKFLGELENPATGNKGRGSTSNTFAFFVVYYMLATEHRLSFYQSFAFFFVNLAFIQVMRSRWWFWGPPGQVELTVFPVYWSTTASLHVQVVLVLNICSCWSLEWDSRARFKAMKTLDKTRMRASDILKKLVPPLVVEDIRNLPARAPPPSHEYKHATIAQSDLCGFTQLSATKKPQEIVAFMSDLFGRFDELCDKRGIWKVETVGDAYIAGQAEIPLTLWRSPISVVLFGNEMVKAVNQWSTERGFAVCCRVGVHHGKCVGGIVGTTSQRYHLFGDLIRILDVLEATGQEGRVQVSKACVQEVQRQIRNESPPEAADILSFEPRREAHLQTSKGEIHTFDEVQGTPFLVRFREPPEEGIEML